MDRHGILLGLGSSLDPLLSEERDSRAQIADSASLPVDINRTLHLAANSLSDPDFFATSHTSGPLTAPSSETSNGNGVYAYGSASLFPSNTYNSNSYGVDVLFKPQLAS